MSEHVQSESNTLKVSRCPFLAGKAFNPFAPGQYNNLQPALAQARKEEPVFFSEALGAWVVTRYEDIYTVFQNPRQFSSAIDGMITASLHPEARELLERGGYRRLPLLFDDQPQHTRSRHILLKLFSKDSIAALEPRIRALTEELVESFVREGQVDLVGAFTHPLPVRVIFMMLGLPVEQMGTFKHWAEELGRFLSMEPMDVERQKECVRNVLAMQDYTAALIAERAKDPRDDGLSVLAQRLKEDAGLDERDLAAMVMLLISAGHETTTGLLGLMVRMLLEQPERWQKLCAEPHLIPRAVEEALRCETPVVATNRVTTEPVQLGGVQLPAGARVMLMLPSGNWDAERFSEPEQFDLNRPGANQHLSFGKGIHVCVGSGLARLEAKVALEVLTQRLPGLRLVEAAQPLPFVVRHHSCLVVAWEQVQVRQAA